MTRAHGHIGERLRPLGFEPEQRKFSAHLTLARVNSLLDGAEQRIIRHTVARERADAGACTVDALTVFRSRTAPSGAVYEPLLRVPLK